MTKILNDENKRLDVLIADGVAWTQKMALNQQGHTYKFNQGIVRLDQGIADVQQGIANLDQSLIDLGQHQDRIDKHQASMILQVKFLEQVVAKLYPLETKSDCPLGLSPLNNHLKNDQTSTPTYLDTNMCQPEDEERPSRSLTN